MVLYSKIKERNKIYIHTLHYTLPLPLGFTIDGKIDNSFGLLGVWYTYTNLYICTYNITILK